MKSNHEINLYGGLALLGVSIIIGAAIVAASISGLLTVSILLGVGLVGFGFWNLISL